MVVVKFRFYLTENQQFLSFLFSLAASADLERHLLEAQKKNVLSLSRNQNSRIILKQRKSNLQLEVIKGNLTGTHTTWIKRPLRRLRFWWKRKDSETRKRQRMRSPLELGMNRCNEKKWKSDSGKGSSWWSLTYNSVRDRQTTREWLNRTIIQMWISTALGNAK